MVGANLTAEDMRRFGEMRSGEKPLDPEDIPQQPHYMNEGIWGEHLVKRMRAKAERDAGGQSLHTENPVPPQMEQIKNLGDIERHPVTFRMQMLHVMPFLYLIYLTVQFLSDPFDDGEPYVRYRERVSAYKV